jgi:hypothetical protein
VVRGGGARAPRGGDGSTQEPPQRESGSPRLSALRRRLAEKALAKIELAIDREEWLGVVEIPDVTLREFLPKLLPILEARHSASTYDSERRGLKVLADYFGKRAMKDVTTAEVTKFITMLRRDRGLAPSTVNQYLTHVSVAWKEAIEHGYAKENPARGVKRLRIERRPRPLPE